MLKFGKKISAGMVHSCKGLLAALVPTLGYLDGAMHIPVFCMLLGEEFLSLTYYFLWPQ